MQEITLKFSSKQIEFLKGYRNGNVQDNIELILDNTISKSDYDVGNTVSLFLESSILITDNEQDTLFMSDVYFNYCKYIEDEMLGKPLGKIKFSRLVRGSGINVDIDSKTRTCLFNVRYKV